MHYRPKPNLVKRLAIISGLTSSLVVGGCLLGDIAAEGLGIAADRHGDQLTSSVLRGAGRVVKKQGQRHQNTRVKYEDANVDIYRDKGLSQNRIAEERAMRDTYNEPAESDFSSTMRELSKARFEEDGRLIKTPSAEPVYDETTQKVLHQIFNVEQGIDYGRIITKVENTCKSNLFDYERNIGIVDRTLNLQGITSDDKSRLIRLLEDMIGSPNKARIMRSGCYSMLEKKRLVTEVLRNRNRIRQNLEGEIKVAEYLAINPEINFELRLKALEMYDRYSNLIRIKYYKKTSNNLINLLRNKIQILEEHFVTNPEVNFELRFKTFKMYTSAIKDLLNYTKPQTTDAIDFIRNKIQTLEGLKDKVPLNKKEISFLYSRGSGSINTCEGLLRTQLKRQNPEEFTNKKKKLEDIVKDYKDYRKIRFGKREVPNPRTRTEVVELAEEIGYSIWLKHSTGWKPDQIQPLQKIVPPQPEITIPQPQEIEPEIIEIEEPPKIKEPTEIEKLKQELAKLKAELEKQKKFQEKPVEKPPVEEETITPPKEIEAPPGF